MSKITLIQLIADGTIPVGTEVFHPARLATARSVTGRIVPGGIEVMGTIYRNPSGAARAVTRTAAENGWIWWRVKGSNQPLAVFRQK